MDIKIFLLEGNPVKRILICADNESDARKYAGSSSNTPAYSKDETKVNPQNINQNLYEDKKIVSCKLLNNNNLNVIERNNQISLQFENKNHTLCKNQPEEL